jgi:hypothetical protein
MGDLKDPRLIYLKGFLFLAAGVMASTILLLEHPSLRVAVLLALAIWCFARFYYFAFYVIEHYVDSSYRFAGLADFALYLIRRRQNRHWSPLSGATRADDE